MKKILTLLMATLLTCSLLLSGCGKESITPEASAKASIKLAFGDISGMQDLGISKIAGEKLEDIGMAAASKTFRDGLKSQGGTLTDEEVIPYLEAIAECCQKVNTTCEVVSQSEDSAQIKITSNTIDLEKATKRAANKVPKGLSTNITDMYRELMKNMVVELSTVEPSDETNEGIFEFKKASSGFGFNKKEYWIPTDMKSFSLKISNLVTGKK